MVDTRGRGLSPHWQNCLCLRLEVKDLLPREGIPRRLPEWVGRQRHLDGEGLGEPGKEGIDQEFGIFGPVDQLRVRF